MAHSISKSNLKLIIEKKDNKVLFAEAGKDFVDFLFYLLSLPVGTIIKLLTKNKMVGSQPNQNKLELLKSQEKTSALLVPGASSQPKQKKFHYCGHYHQYVADALWTACGRWIRQMT
ncbi:hypothetical protein Pint_06218 [Pistacia integerrima]|uniref:Uncharacterized protein n=1 Tax=Pistacia integerrima TaxID=434235 RepID=A0ACC0Z1H1_9ROSI|nr:hypothetical protein Pint_06218 [Pistacia integerrima]